MTLLDLCGVACRRGGRMLFEGLDLTLRPGDAAVVTGPNGIGKSSLIRLAASLLRPAAGTVGASPAALLDERSALDPERTVGAALRFWMQVGSYTSSSPAQAGAQSEDAAAFREPPPPWPAPGYDMGEALDALDLTALADVPVRFLSTGQRRRAALARVALSPVPLWLLDEPANGLDTAAVTRLEALIAAHRARGGAVLVATHLPLAMPDAQAITLGSAA